MRALRWFPRPRAHQTGTASRASNAADAQTLAAPLFANARAPNRQPPAAKTKNYNKPQLVINEIADTAPIGLRAVKLFAQARGGAVTAEAALATLSEWREGDVAGAARDPHVLLVAGALHASGGNHVEALKACNAGPQTLEM